MTTEITADCLRELPVDVLRMVAQDIGGVKKYHLLKRAELMDALVQRARTEAGTRDMLAQELAHRRRYGKGNHKVR